MTGLSILQPHFTISKMKSCTYSISKNNIQSNKNFLVIIHVLQKAIIASSVKLNFKSAGIKAGK
jgi:hypothetical protein